VTGPLPAGIYNVRQRVVRDTCNLTGNLPAQVSVLKRHGPLGTRVNVPIQRFGTWTKYANRREMSERGFSGGGGSHPQICPGQQQTFEERVSVFADNAFHVAVEYEVRDGWDCPNPRPHALCQASIEYDYTLAFAACDSRCEGFVPNMRDEDVPDGPVAITCAC